MDQPLNGTFPYYSDGVEGESYGAGDYKATNGRLYKVSDSGAGTPLAWYPATGNRERAFGAQRYIGGEGFSWSSATSGTDGMSLYFHSQSLSPSNTAGHSFGFPLRCLSE